MTKHYIIGNFGNHSMAVAQWAIEQGINDLTFLAIDTGWAASAWLKRVDSCRSYLENSGISTSLRKSVASFEQMVRQRGEFPCQKFQWCAGFLKGLAINDYLDEVDFDCEAVLLLGKRKTDSRVSALLSEYTMNSEHYNERTLWYPLINSSEGDFRQLIARSGLPFLNHRALECHPCIHSTRDELHSLASFEKNRLSQLEKELGNCMFPVTFIDEELKTKGSTIERFDMGCGSPWGCGE
jgi:3'-phosphoadenosine 5'-phosphosulfate sulfotransferase (PAPS reductase)/FAD synthetase